MRNIQTPILHISSNGLWRISCSRSQESSILTPACLTLHGRNNNDWTMAWSRRAVNRRAPQKILVTDDGEHVVTFDEWDEGGDGLLPVVIYGRYGDLICAHSFETLGLSYHALFTPSLDGRTWRNHSIIYFSEDQKIVYIALSSGSILPLLMKTGEILDDIWYQRYGEKYFSRSKWDAIQNDGVSGIRHSVQKLLYSSDPIDQICACETAERIKMSEAIEPMRSLLSSKYFEGHQIDGGKIEMVYPVRIAAAKAISSIGK